MSDEADRVWRHAVDDDRPRPRELLRAELELRRSNRSSPKKLAADIQASATVREPARLRAPHLLVAAAALVVTVAVSAWQTRAEPTPEEPQTLAPAPALPPTVPPAIDSWDAAFAVLTDPNSTAQRRSEACSCIDDALYEIAKATRELLADEVVTAKVRAAREQWANELDGIALEQMTHAEGDPASHMKVLADVTASSTEREWALVLMHPLVRAGLARLRDFQPFDDETRMMHPATLRRLRDTLR